MKNQAFFAFITLVLAGSAFATGAKHDHVHDHKPLHGGVVVEVKDIDYELVARPTTILLYLRDHGKAIDVSRASARITLLTGTERQQVELEPAADKLEAVGSSGTTVCSVVPSAGCNAGGKNASFWPAASLSMRPRSRLRSRSLTPAIGGTATPSTISRSNHQRLTGLRAPPPTRSS